MKYLLSILVTIICVGILNRPQDVWGGESFEIYRYENIWRGTVDLDSSLLNYKQGKVDMTMTIRGGTDNDQKISWEMNGKSFEHVEYQYLSNTFSIHMPQVLCVYARDGKYEHTFCGMLYSHIYPDNQIRGIYELTFPCQISGKPDQCVQQVAIELQATINLYDGHK